VGVDVRAIALAAIVGMLAFSGVARADVPPPDSCPPGDQGKRCTTTQGFTGTCVNAKCTRASPEGGTTEFDCVRCIVLDAGAADAGFLADASDVRTPAPAGCSCTTAAGGAAPFALGLAAIGLALFVKRRGGRDTR
jgi:MYXO-CTERM domain-containing protein